MPQVWHGNQVVDVPPGQPCTFGEISLRSTYSVVPAPPQRPSWRPTRDDAIRGAPVAAQKAKK